MILSLDVGSSSVRAVLVDRDGRVVPGPAHREPHALDTAPDGSAVFDSADLMHRTERCLDQVAGGLPSAAVRAVVVSQFVSNVLGVGTDARPLTPVFTYADTRSAPQLEEIKSAVDADAVHERTGCPLHTSYLPARFRWLRQWQPDLMNVSIRWISFGEWAMERVLGRSLCSYSVASWTGLLNIHKLDWDADWLSELGIARSQLGTLVDGSECLTGLTPSFHARWPALREAVWFAPLADGVASNLGSGCTTSSQVALSVGTSGALRLVHDRPLVPAGLWCYRIDRERCLIGGAINDAGSVLAWTRGLLGMSEEEIQGALDSGNVDDHGLTMLPFLTGERSPGWCPRARCVAMGMSPETSRAEFFRASLESVALRFLAIAQRLQSVTGEVNRVVASGGGFQRLPAWAQMMADALGRPVTMSAEPEPSARGAALVALKSLGMIASYEDLPAAFGATYLPRPERTDRYRDALRRQTELYHLLF